MASSVTTEDLKAFHAMDRDLYKRLVIDSGRDLFTCMHVIALWIFLEEIGYPNIVEKLLRMNDAVVNFILNEAIRCLDCLKSVTPPIPVVNIHDLPLTQELMGNKAISLSLVYQYRDDALTRVNQTVKDVFVRAFDDIVQEAVWAGRKS
ncbi:uncharacterized protein LOC113294074 [Papaver somniferum]|uniref:uncharacterized protein LOC113294074 n=1 Tax=Papaver somniferum TaxID=3469 RepID=UPI000E705D9B|nr:uncharacterized protein LOC113294074 [Papaver somniferum]